jgi:hypothetical protein
MAIEKTVVLNVETGDAQKDVKNLNKELDNTAGSLDGVTSAADGFTGGAITKFKGLTGTLKGVTGGFKTMRMAIISTGIGALVIGVVALVAAFKSSEKGQNQWQKIMGVIGSITGNFVDLLADLGELLIRVFTEPKKVLMEFKDSIERYVTKQIGLVMDGLGLLGSAIKKVFSGDFSGALKDAGAGMKKLLIDTSPVVQITNALAGATKNLVKELVAESKIAGDIADKRALSDKLERALIVDRAVAEQTRAQLLEKAIQKDKFNQEERIAFLQEAADIDTKITNQAIASAKLKLDAKILENGLSRSTKEDLEEEANLRAQLIGLETVRLTKAKETTSQILALNAEAKAIVDADILEKQTKQAETDALEVQRLTDLETLKLAIRDATALSQSERDALEIEKTQEKYDLLIAQATKFGEDTTELTKAKETAVVDMKNDFAKRDSANQIKWEELTTDEKLSIASDGFNNLASILGAETAAGKAAAIAAATIQTYLSATSSYASLSSIPIIGPALGAVAAGAAIASGIGQVKKIIGTKTPSLGGGGGKSVSGGTPSGGGAPSPPSFNVVGASETNQLADVIGTAEQQPVRAYVASNDVTTAQTLDRNIVDGASIG